MQNFRFQILNIQLNFLSQQFSKHEDFKALQFLYTTKFKVVEVNVNFYIPWKYQKNTNFLCFQGA